jgi:anti-sigma-K factor RskA
VRILPARKYHRAWARSYAREAAAERDPQRAAFSRRLARRARLRHIRNCALWALVAVAAAAAAVVAVALSGCQAAHPPATPKTGSVKAAAVTYMKAHPAALVPGMVAGIVYDGTVGSVNCDPAHPGTTGCGAWSLWIYTPSGAPFYVTCGGFLAPQIPCPDTAYPWPVLGDYLYVPLTGRVTSNGDVRVIRSGAAGQMPVGP